MHGTRIEPERILEYQLDIYSAAIRSARSLNFPSARTPRGQKFRMQPIAVRRRTAILKSCEEPPACSYARLQAASQPLQPGEHTPARSQPPTGFFVQRG